jgi:DNA-binding MarR family transcriptional regulator
VSGVSFSVPLPFDPIRRAAELWRARWGPDSHFLAMAAATSVMRVQQLLLARFDATVGRHGLTFARYEALVLLAFSRDGRLPMSKIGERLMVHPTSATNIIQRLAAQGLVDRSPNPADGRGTLATITLSGREVMEHATRDLVDAGFGLGALSPQELRQLFRLLRKVRLDADDFDDDLAQDLDDDGAQGPGDQVAPDPADDAVAPDASSVAPPSRT